MSRRTLLFGGLGAAAALGGGTAWGLDRYVLEHVEVENASALKPPKASAAPVATAGTYTATSYRSATATVTIESVTQGSGDDLLRHHVADITVANGTILKSWFAENKFGRNIRALPTEMAADVEAVVAVNGDFSGYRDDGIVIRNGVSFRDKGTRHGLAFHADGTARVYDERTTSAAKLIEEGVWHTLSFGPALLDNGKIPPGIEEHEIGDFGPVVRGGPGSIQGNQPRTGIGVVDTNHFVMITADGRGAGGSRGATMTEFARMFQEAGAKIAYNLDGGASATMVFNGKVVNKPSNGKQRSSGDILYVAG